MTPELEQHIREQYPLIFSQPCEMSINDGWFDIIDMLCANIQNRIEDNLIQYTLGYNLPLPWTTIITPDNPSI